MGSKRTPMMVLMMVVTLVCAAIIPATPGPLLLLPSSVFAQQEETSLGEREDVASGIVSDVLDGVGGNDDEEEENEGDAAGDDTNRQIAVPIIDQDRGAANLAEQRAAAIDVEEKQKEQQKEQQQSPADDEEDTVAATTKTYQIVVTLTDVPNNAEDLEMNVTIMRMPFFVSVSETQIKTVSSPSEGETIRFDLKVPSGSNEDSVFVCGTQVSSGINDCELYPLPSVGGGPIRVDFSYP